ncbi:TRAP transporter substrate-binding protein [Bradyrhizobium sp. 190]|uniref:TRAP transporter substrate-binding protein n=1 Tax=Bradyrhizobium sp. 190 TaxID=2782658 RepID=UPI001FF7F9A5|nr:TRAP transporter substrate-binding protein [Bradyrhizobium sp. 190]MCK1513217.1 TRAP transporter substrate-binding protein [Bradyrhizobium sp. 190]
MNDVSRRTVVRGIAATAGSTLGFPALAQREGIKFKLGTDVPETFPTVVYARKAAEKIASESNGRLRIEIFPANQLGSSTDLLSQVRSGAVEMVALQGTTLSTLAPVAGINTVTFAFKEYATVWDAMDGDVGTLVRKSLAPLGLHVATKMWDGGFRQVFTASKRISSPDDLKGLKIRVPVSPIFVSTFRALGSSPAAINVAELYSALQAGIADGCELPLTGIDSLKLYEVQKQCSMTNHLWDGPWQVVNAKVWSRLPSDLQDIFIRNFDAVAEEQRRFTQQQATDLVPELEKKGMVFTRPDPAPFRKVLAASGFYGEWQSKFGSEAWAVLERYTGKLS